MTSDGNGKDPLNVCSWNSLNSQIIYYKSIALVVYRWWMRNSFYHCVRCQWRSEEKNQLNHRRPPFKPYLNKHFEYPLQATLGFEEVLNEVESSVVFLSAREWVPCRLLSFSKKCLVGKCWFIIHVFEALVHFGFLFFDVNRILFYLLW